MSSTNVDLGFVEKVDPNKNTLKSKYFPSKVGGKPCWLALSGLPRADVLQCSPCGKQLTFLMQIYAPIEDNPSAFHRTLFVFCCNTCSKTFKVFRCQLKRENEFYSPEPPNYDIANTDDEGDLCEERHDKLCSICGCYADSWCSNCKSVNYCSREHQVYDWKENDHKTYCGQRKSQKLSKCLLTEYEVVIEPEEFDGSDEEEDEEDELEAARMKEYLRYVNKLKPSCQNEDIENPIKEDPSLDLFCKFKSRIKAAPQQIVRYCQLNDSDPEPLWISKEYPLQVPNCVNCGSKRRFEFQIMPALLNYFKSPNLDFGTLIVYSCSKSCDSESSKYLEEFVWQQNASS